MRLWPELALSWQSWTSLSAQLHQHAWAANAPEKQNKSASTELLLPPPLGGSSEPAFSVTVRGRYPLRDFWEEELFPKVPGRCRTLITLGFCCLSALPVLEQGEERQGCYMFWQLSLFSLGIALASCISYLMCVLFPHMEYSWGGRFISRKAFPLPKHGSGTGEGEGR